jgi:deoxycytidylate deaminase
MCSMNVIDYTSKKHLNICKIAHEEAKKSDIDKSKHGAVILKGNTIIGTGYNKYCNNINKKCYTDHAEIEAIVNAIKIYGKESLYNTELYVVRIAKDNIDIKSRHGLRMSKPCKNCTNFIIKNNIKTVYYSID